MTPTKPTLSSYVLLASGTRTQQRNAKVDMAHGETHGGYVARVSGAIATFAIADRYGLAVVVIDRPSQFVNERVERLPDEKPSEFGCRVGARLAQVLVCPGRA